MSDGAPRFLNFDHAGVSYLVVARPGVEGVDLSLERGGAYWRGFGSIPYDTIAGGADMGADLVEERMCAIRDAVLLGDVS